MVIDLLRDLELAGVKWELNDTPATHQKETAAKKDKEEKGGVSGSTIVPATAPVNIAAAAAVAKTAAERASDFESLRNEIADFSHPLKAFAKNTILPTDGDKLLVITDMPSFDDEAFGQILSGAAGELFDKMMLSINLHRDDIAVTPLIFWRPPGGRTPLREELDLARPFVNRVIELLQPAVILTLGSLAKEECAKCEMQNENIFSIFHPNYLLLKPDAKRSAWETLQKMKDEIYLKK